MGRTKALIEGHGMDARFRAFAYLLLVAAALLIGGRPARGDHLEQHKIAGNIEVFYGIVPAEVIRGYPKGSDENKMHGGVPRGAAQYHLMVSLFEVKTKQPVLNADVRAKVTELGLGAQEKSLERMSLAGTMSYGNYFRLPPGRYEIAVHIRRPGVPGVVEAKFDYSVSRK
jgi:hypothetical protein